MSSPVVDILLAEDDEDLRDAMIDTLNDAGYRVAAVANGLDALEWLRSAEQPPALILLDLMMPIMDGWRFREEQLREPKVASIPVVVLSAMRNAVGSQGVEYLEKPVKLQPLLAVVARHCGPGRSSSA